MDSLGTVFNLAREGRKLSLSQAAEATRISYRHLQSIEESRFRDLPGGMYNRAFLRAYSEYLGLDPQPILERYDAETTPLPVKKTYRPKVPVPQNSYGRRINPLWAWALMLVASIAGIFFSRHWIAEVFSPYFSSPPAAKVAASPAPPAPTSRPAATPAVSPAPVAELATAPIEPAGGATHGSEPPSGSPAAGSLASTAAAEPSNADPSAPKIRIRFEVLETCWASVTADNRKVLSRQLNPGDDKDFSADDSVLVVLGNAGGIRLTINGKPARALGKPGDVVKVLITEQNLAELIQPPTQNP